MKKKSQIYDLNFPQISVIEFNPHICRCKYLYYFLVNKLEATYKAYNSYLNVGIKQMSTSERK